MTAVAGAGAGPSDATGPATAPAVIELDGVARVHPGDPPVAALRRADLVVRTGEYVAIVGPSGSGKSTLLNVIGCLDRHTAGVYRLDGVDVSTLSDRQRALARAERIGFVFQAFHLLTNRSIEENVMLAELYTRRPRRGRRQRALSSLEQVGLDHRIGFPAGRLSGGERQRVAVARALVARPSLLLCDEPTGNLDSRTAASLLDLLEQLRAGGLTILLITHDPVVAARADRRFRIEDGVTSDDPTEPA